MFSLCPLTAFLTLTLHLLFVDVLAHLSGVLLRRFTLGEECGMLDIKPVPLRFQLVGLLQKVKHRRRFAVNSILLDKLSQLYGGAEGQALLDAVTAEHTLIGKLTASGMTYEQIGELADDSSADADNSSDESYSEKYAKQMSFSETDHSYSE